MPITWQQNKHLRALIKEQPTAMDSPIFRQQVAGSLLISAGERENPRLHTDWPMAQLTLDFVWARLPIFSPEATITSEAVKRLLFSARSAPAEMDLETPERSRPSYPRCGGEMVFHVGIGEPDFFLCEATIRGKARPAQELAESGGSGGGGRQ
jgi:hypothetical protein